MSEINEHIMLSEVADKIGRITEEKNLRQNSGTEYTADDVAAVKPLEKLTFQGAFQELEGEVLNDQCLSAYLEDMKKKIFRAPAGTHPDMKAIDEYTQMRAIFQEGSTMMLAAFPCDQNGAAYSAQDVVQHKYFKVLYIDPKTGTSSGFGSWYGPYANILPAEIQQNCKFTISYPKDVPRSSQKDWEYLEKVLTEKFTALQKAIKG
jgi:hypothetical protein